MKRDTGKQIGPESSALKETVEQIQEKADRER